LGENGKVKGGGKGGRLMVWEKKRVKGREKGGLRLLEKEGGYVCGRGRVKGGKWKG
jgi:hypothetical protein